jgi:hypothetical protein
LISTLGALGHCAIWKYINQNWMEGVRTSYSDSPALQNLWSLAIRITIHLYIFNYTDQFFSQKKRKPSQRPRRLAFMIVVLRVCLQRFARSFDHISPTVHVE